MTDINNPLATLDARRVALGMTVDVVARRAGVSPSTVERVMSGRYGAASFAAVQRIAAALGAEVRVHGIAEIAAMRANQADRKARQTIGAAPPADAVRNPPASGAADTAAQEALVQQTIHKLLAGSKRKLWAD